MSKLDKLKIGFVGAGIHAKANIYASLQLLDVPIQSISTRHLESAEKAAKEFQANNAYDNYKEMLAKEEFDAVFVVTDKDTQAEITKACLRSGTNVFVEKPLGMDEKEAREVADISRETGKHVMVGFMKRFAPTYLKLKSIMDNHVRFGDKKSFRGMFAITSGRPGWDNEVFLKVGGIHYVDLMRFLFGEAVDAIGMTNSQDVLVDQLFTLRFENGMIGSMFFGGLPAWARHWEEITVSGVNGFVKVNNMVNVEYHYVNPEIKPSWKDVTLEDGILTPKNTSSSGGWKDLFLNGYVGEVEHFLNCVINDNEPECSAFDNVKTMKLCDTILSNLKQ